MKAPVAVHETGSLSGILSSVEIATIGNHPIMTAGDIFIG